MAHRQHALPGAWERRECVTCSTNLSADDLKDIVTVLVEEGKPPGDFLVYMFTPRGGRTTKTLGSGTPEAVKEKGSMQSKDEGQGLSSPLPPR